MQKAAGPEHEEKNDARESNQPQRSENAPG